jgi:hypothetical protein
MSSATGPYRRQEILSANFLERAKHYHFAAAMSQSPYEIERFCEIAGMFELLARETQPSSSDSGFASVRRRRDQSVFSNAIKTHMIWLGGIVTAMRDRLTAMAKCLPNARKSVTLMDDLELTIRRGLRKKLGVGRESRQNPDCRQRIPQRELHNSAQMVGAGDPKLLRYNKLNRGDYSAAREQPAFAEIRNAFRSLRNA